MIVPRLLCMKHVFCIGILFLFFCGFAPRKNNGNGYSEDFRILVQSLRELDPMLYKVTGKDTFDARVVRIEERISSCTSKYEAMYIMQEFMYDLGDSHASITSSYGNLGVQRILPFKVFVLDDKLYIRNYPAKSALNSAEIFSIDNVPSKEIIDSLRIFYPNDGRREIIGFGLPALFNSLYAAFCHQADSFSIATSKETFNVPAVKKGDKDFGELVSYSWMDYMNTDSSFCKEVHNDYGYFRFTDFARIEEGHNVEEEFGSLISELNQRNIRNIVIDLRYNSGGDPYIAGRMASYFTNKPFRIFERLILTATRKTTYSSYMVKNFTYRFRHAGTRHVAGHREKVKFEKGLKEFQPSPHHFNGTVYVITGSMTGSSATMLCKYLQDLDNVKFVGSETEGATNYFCAHRHCELTLPNTRIYVSFGMQIVELEKGSSDTEKPTGLIPLNYVTYSIDDLMNRTDKEMNWIRNDIAVSNPGTK